MSDILRTTLARLTYGRKIADDDIVKLCDRIAELEAALRDVLAYVDTCNSWHREAQAKGYAALKGGKKE